MRRREFIAGLGGAAATRIAPGGFVYLGLFRRVPTKNVRVAKHSHPVHAGRVEIGRECAASIRVTA
jgi:hypothetical protein